jgi:TetR/AcrR family tetracycline transcriptional repressor
VPPAARVDPFGWPPEPPPARMPLDRARLVQAALELLDEVGLQELTMRRLADRLGVRSASLYWHVRDKDQLLDLLSDTICGELQLPALSGDWRTDLEAVAWAYRRVLQAHRDAATIVASTLPLGPNRLRLADAMLGVLLEAGFSPAVVGHAGLLFTDFVTNFVIEEARSETVARSFDPEHAGDGLAAVRAWFAGLPAQQYPNLAALADHLVDADADARFRFGLGVLLDGLETHRHR